MKVGRFGLGFKSVFHMTGKVNKISGPEKVKKSSDQSSPTSALRETT